ncbi:hypothetical protein HOLleu_12645 [Holothuria leucospilota]|uniref:Uncharacterized protein n=1 Tax=Holothuria leucospilota TaxID=206669 RepID=A0A9Q1HA97_HOLLE|nr:hypothetical protein HOLleu_12645 [Holothuria leucospilota]
MVYIPSNEIPSRFCLFLGSELADLCERNRGRGICQTSAVAWAKSQGGGEGGMEKLLLTKPHVVVTISLGTDSTSDFISVNVRSAWKTSPTRYTPALD